jgi:anti-anti-sigma factor
VDTRADGSKLIVSLTDVDIAGEAAIRATGERLTQLVYEGARYLVVDVHKTTYLNSAVLAMFITLHKLLYITDGVFIIRNPSEQVDELFRITRLSEILDVEREGENPGKPNPGEP